MKNCKYCTESIADDALKCPKCHSSQNKLLNGLALALFPILMIAFVIYINYSVGPDKYERFTDHQDEIILSVLSIDTIMQNARDQEDQLNIIVKLKNETSEEWSVGNFEVLFKSNDGRLMNIEKTTDYQLTLHPKSSSMSSLKVPFYAKYQNTDIEVNLANLRHSWP